VSNLGDITIAAVAVFKHFNDGLADNTLFISSNMRDGASWSEHP